MFYVCKNSIFLKCTYVYMRVHIRGYEGDMIWAYEGCISKLWMWFILSEIYESFSNTPFLVSIYRKMIDDCAFYYRKLYHYIMILFQLENQPRNKQKLEYISSFIDKKLCMQQEKVYKLVCIHFPYIAKWSQYT